MGRKIRTFRALLLVSIFLATIAYFAFYMAYTNNLEAVDSFAKKNIKFDINKGESVSIIAQKLYQEDLIKEPWAFKLYVKKNNKEQAFQVGSFVLQQSFDTSEIVKVLTGLPSEMWLTTLEGWNITEIADYLDKNNFANKKEFLDCVRDCEFDYEILSSIPEEQGLEGYLFPDTYIITAATKPMGIINRMLQNLSLKFDSTLQARASEMGKTVHEILTMASLIEKEVNEEKDAKIVSGILWKRLEAGMSLGVDASVLYALGDWKATLDYEALQIDSPYNTRKYAGLPPGPICNPGLSSIKAALYPENSEYWFYLTTLDTGEVVFSRNLDEHNYNVAKYLR